MKKHQHQNKENELVSGESQDQNDGIKVNIDTILINEIGQFGWYQLKIIALCVFVGIFVAWNTNQFLFAAARIDTRCFIRGCDKSDQTEFTPSWLENAIPVINGSVDNCKKYASLDTFQDDDTFETCPASLFDREETVPCEEFVYENTDSVVYDYNLACDEWRRSLIGTIRTVGTLFSFPIIGYISDRWGRRTCMILNIFVAACIGLLRVFAKTYAGFVTSQFFEAFGFGALSCAYIMSMETVGYKFRVASAACISSSFAIGQVILAGIAWLLPYWKHLTLALYAPQLIIISYLWLMPENYKWYVGKGRYEDAVKVLEKAAKTNKRVLSEESKMILKLAAEENSNKTEMEEKEPWLVIQVFTNKPILIRCIVAPVLWITTMVVYYGLTINAVHLAGNFYQNFMLVAVVEIPGFWLAVLLTNKTGRRPVLCGGFWVCAVCLIAYIFVSDELYALNLTLYLLGKISISTVMVCMNLYTAELFPTKYRHSLYSFTNMVGRLGHIVAPITPALSEEIWVNLPFVLFASLALLSGALVFLTPETVGANLPDTMDQANNIGKKGQALN